MLKSLLPVVIYTEMAIGRRHVRIHHLLILPGNNDLGIFSTLSGKPEDFRYRVAEDSR